MLEARVLLETPPVRLIACGLALVLAAQVLPGAPVAGAIALVGLGATRQIARTWAASPVLVAVNGLAYAGIAALAVGAEAHAGAAPMAVVLLDALAALAVLTLIGGVLLQTLDERTR